MTEPEESELDERAERLFRTREEIRANARVEIVRWIVGGIVILGLGICWAVVKIHDNPWPEVVLIISLVLISAFTGGAGPTIFAFKWRKKYREIIDRIYDRNVELEKKDNPERNSSSINPDGSAAEDD